MWWKHHIFQHLNSQDLQSHSQQVFSVLNTQGCFYFHPVINIILMFLYFLLSELTVWALMDVCGFRLNWYYLAAVLGSFTTWLILHRWSGPSSHWHNKQSKLYEGNWSVGWRHIRSVLAFVDHVLQWALCGNSLSVQKYVDLCVLLLWVCFVWYRRF